jgi:hypothetical protein
MKAIEKKEGEMDKETYFFFLAALRFMGVWQGVAMDSLKFHPARLLPLRPF